MNRESEKMNQNEEVNQFADVVLEMRESNVGEVGESWFWKIFNALLSVEQTKNKITNRWLFLFVENFCAKCAVFWGDIGSVDILILVVVLGNFD